MNYIGSGGAAGMKPLRYSLLDGTADAFAAAATKWGFALRSPNLSSFCATPLYIPALFIRAAIHGRHAACFLPSAC